ncbi:MAG: pyridoxal kinase PdxY [Geminicoccaceae bacterium]|nr:MAG: pyridoxal kinase PdxY [Geminicoccaceae bacterium]
MEGILSIQSHVSYGHVGNSAAVFPLQRLGFEVWPIMTVLFSNHTGYGAFRGRPVGADWQREILAGLEERGALARTRAVLSGYLGDPATAEVVVEAVERVRRHRPDAVYACDPVIGDDGRGVFVRPGIPELLRDRILPLATLVKPNRFELSHLTGIEVRTLDDALEAARSLRARGPELVVVTSLSLPDREGALGMLADSAEGSWVVWTPRLPVTLNGTGDVFAALLLGEWLLTRDPEKALARTASAVYGLVEATWRAESRELLLVEAQEAIVGPPHEFRPTRLR